ncbi:MAG: hypothetical protein QP780_11160 [Brevibacterium sp. UMB1308B]|nr:hypothetical protein [Brevibacterium sp. UMB1308B]
MPRTTAKQAGLLRHSGWRESFRVPAEPALTKPASEATLKRFYDLTPEKPVSGESGTV